MTRVAKCCHNLHAVTSLRKAIKDSIGKCNHITVFPEVGREREKCVNDALNTFYLRLYGVRHMVKDHSDSEKGNPLPPHRLLLSINSKGYFIFLRLALQCRNVHKNNNHDAIGRRLPGTNQGRETLFTFPYTFIFLVPASVPRLV